MKFVLALVIAFISSLSLADNAEWEAKKQKMEERTDEAASDMGRGIKKASRSIQDKACGMIDGKMECAAEKAKHSIQNGADNVEDAID